MTSVYCIGYTSCKVYMIVFQQYHIEKSDTMIAPSTNLYSLLFKHSHSGCCFSCVQYSRFRSCNTLHIFISHGCNTAHTLHYIQHEPFCLQQRTYFSRDNHRHVTFTHLNTIIYKHFHIH